ncbi:hypothetical protein V8J36_05395 [Frigidibacter sp. MR17.14]|uniref:hypothetical protein n=1 Tax=Frigidibacter sp. MR17.14 TaxID=3126509 RepID=UPI003012A1DE
MPMLPMTDEDLLGVLALWDAGFTGQEIGQRIGRSRNAVLGALHRIRHDERPCHCLKPENRDGGMPAGWWKRRKVAA